MFLKFKDQNYPKSTPHNNLDLRIIDDVVFPFIRWFRLHSIAARLSVFPCVELIEWIIGHIDCKKFLIDNDKVKFIGSFVP